MLTWLVNSIIRLILHFIVKVDKAELKKVPKQGPLILAVNHVNFLEVPVLIIHLLPRPITGFVKKETWDNPLMAFLFNLWGGIPIERDSADFKAFHDAKQALSEGKIVAVAPEGTRTGDGNLVKGKPGIAIIASQCQVPILPIAHYGHEDYKASYRKLRRPHMHIKVGKPFLVNFNGQQKDKQVLQTVSDAIMLEVAALMPQKYHGAYAHISVDKDKYLRYLDQSPGEHIPEALMEQFSQT